MKCANCGSDNPAGARFCLNCGAALPLRCPSCGGELPSGARFCLHCGQPLVAATSSDDVQLSRLAAATPEPLAEKLRADELAGEHRVVTVLFADVVGSTELARRLGAEAWMHIVSELLDRITPAIYRYEGTIAHLLSDGVWAFFGAPVAHEDDPLRAVHAGLDLLDAARAYAVEVRQEYGVELAMRACLNTGPVVVGPVGDDLRYEYTASGPTVNLAARLKFVAGSMSLVVSEHTHRFIAPLFHTEDAGQIEARGGAGAVRVYRVCGPRAAPGRLRGLAGAGLESPMVGRDAELAALLQLGEAVRAGLGRAVLILGEPGLGKTRLISEWRAALDRHPGRQPPLWAEGRCLSYGQGLAYHLLVDLLRAILGVPEAAGEAETRTALHALTDDLFAQAAPKVYPYLGHLLSVRLEEDAAQQVGLLDPQALQARYVAAVRQLMGALAARQPLVLVLEDLHWADPSSTDLFVKLLPLVSAAPVLLCIASRPERDAPAWRLVMAARETLGSSLTEIGLHALSDRDSRQLVANLLQIEALPESVRATILKKAEGNPFFVEEVIRMLIDRGAIVKRGDDWIAAAGIDEVEIPDNLHSLLLARIDRLPEDVRHTLRVAAVVGRQFPVKVLEYVLQGGTTS